MPVIKDPEIYEDFVKLIVLSKFSGDLIGDTEPIRERTENVLPSKIFKMSTMWLRIVFRRDGCEDILLLKNPKPNSMYETPLVIAYADESDDYSMRVVYPPPAPPPGHPPGPPPASPPAPHPPPS